MRDHAIRDSFNIARYDERDRDEVFALLRETLPPPASERLMRQWDWKYDRNPFNPDGRPYILLLKDGPRLIAMLGTLPLRAAINGVERYVSHSCDWVLRAEYRNRGTGRPLVHRLRTERPLRFSWQNALSYRSLRHSRGTYARLLPLIKPLDIGRLVTQVTGSRTLGRGSAALVAATRRVTSALTRDTADAPIRITQLTSFDERFDDLWRRVHPHYPVIVVRDRAYLQWRFGQRPDVSYLILGALRGAELAGYLILRAGEVDDERLGFLVDFLVEPGGTRTLTALVRAAVEWLRRDGAKAISCRASAAAHRCTLYTHGFLPFFWGPPGYAHAVAETALPADARSFEDLRHWYLTMGDGDLEMAF